MCLLQALAIGCGLHANSVQIESVRTVSSLLHNLLDAGTSGMYPSKPAAGNIFRKSSLFQNERLVEATVNETYEIRPEL